MDNLVKLCECGCGNPSGFYTRTKSKFGIIKGQPKRFIYGHNSTSRLIDLTGQKFGDWKVLQQIKKRTNSGEIMWICVCDYGHKKNIHGRSLKRGLSRICHICKYRYCSKGHDTWVHGRVSKGKRGTRCKLCERKRDKIGTRYVNRYINKRKKLLKQRRARILNQLK